MKTSIVPIFLCLFLLACSNKPNHRDQKRQPLEQVEHLEASKTETESQAKNEEKESSIQGIYSYGSSGYAYGNIVVIPESDSSFLFHIELNRGGPSYNMGMMYDRAKLDDNTGTFYTKFEFAEQGCQWEFTFKKKSLEIKTINDQYECGFGFGVSADGEYEKTSSKVPAFFEDFEGTKHYYKETDPEDYNRN